MLKQICFQKSPLKLLRSLNTFTRTTQNAKNTRGTKDILPQIMSNSSITKASDWKSVRNQLLGEGEMFTEKSVDSILLNYCISNKKFDHAKKYIEFLETANIKPNLGAIGKYFKLYYMMYSDKEMDERDEKYILRRYEELRKEHKLLDSITIEQAICGLSVTNSWKKCLDLLKESKLTVVPNNTAYNAVVSAAFRNNENKLGWKLFNEMIENDRYPQNITYETIFNQIETKHSLKSADLLSMLETLFELLEAHDLYFEKEIANKLIEMSKRINVTAALTNISTQGVCSNCKIKLDETKLTNKEFSVLRDTFFKEVIVGRDVFCKTTPEELNRFKTFVNNMGDFDVVIDGLNTQYSQGVAQGPQAVSTLLANVVSYFVNHNKKVLLLGRNHMERLPAKNWNFIKRNCTVFLTQNISQDDPFILYCALNSGINTNIVTRDLMRSHLYLLQDRQCKKLFRRWLAQNRLHLVTVQKGKVIFREPLKYMIAPQKTKDGWHIPYIHEVTENPKSVKYRWICIGV